MKSPSKIIMFALGAIGALLVTISLSVPFFVGFYTIPQNGMSPSLPSGTFVLIAKRPYSSPSNVRRGDIIVFVREENGQHYKYIWRVIALPGEKVEAFGKSLAINGHVVKQQFIHDEHDKEVFREKIGGISYDVAFDRSPSYRPPNVSLTVPINQFFVMGDNRFNARDSRYFGPISFGSIIGKKL